jgi:peptide/nickel transport system permease protein
MSTALRQAYRLRGNTFLRGSVSSRSGQLGLAVVVLICAVAFLGPLASPYSPTDTVGVPFTGPSGAHIFGTDGLGRDGLSRFLYGGRALIVVAFLATALAYVVGIPLGMAAGYRRGLFDLTTVVVADLILSFPPIVFVLVLLAAAGPHLSIVVASIATIHAPRVMRISRSVTIDIATQEFVEAAVARGESLLSILRHDILPNIWTPVLADFGIRLTGSVILFSSLSYLGLGQPPPAADWGLMISENRTGLLVQPWIVIVPAVTIALLAIGVNLVADAIARSVGRSVVGRDV